MLLTQLVGFEHLLQRIEEPSSAFEITRRFHVCPQRPEIELDCLEGECPHACIVCEVAHVRPTTIDELTGLEDPKHRIHRSRDV